MGKKIHLEKVLAFFEKSPVVDFKSIARIVGGDKKSNYTKLLVHNLIKSGRINKIGKGVYTKHNELSLSVFVFKPSYIGLQSALSHHKIWEQETIPVIITTRKVRLGRREIIGGNILVKNISKKYFFGYELIEEGNFYFPYSDIEKTLIDFVVFNQKIDKETLKKIKKRIHVHKLKKYLKKYSSKTRQRVIKLLNIQDQFASA